MAIIGVFMSVKDCFFCDVPDGRRTKWRGRIQKKGRLKCVYKWDITHDNTAASHHEGFSIYRRYFQKIKSQQADEMMCNKNWTRNNFIITVPKMSAFGKVTCVVKIKKTQTTQYLSPKKFDTKAFLEKHPWRWLAVVNEGQNSRQQQLLGTRMRQNKNMFLPT